MLKKRRAARNVVEMKSPEAMEQPRGPPHHERVCVLASIYYLYFGLCMYSTVGLG